MQFGGLAPRAAVLGAAALGVGRDAAEHGRAVGTAAAGVHEAIYSLLMMEHDFIAASANIESLDEAAGNMPIVRQRIDNAGLNRVMSNSFGFGGTNASLVLGRYSG